MHRAIKRLQHERNEAMEMLKKWQDTADGATKLIKDMDAAIVKLIAERDEATPTVAELQDEIDNLRYEQDMISRERDEAREACRAAIIQLWKILGDSVWDDAAKRHPWLV
jgi:uncharacterized coiled-coil DUF342 family protein